jgi:hypothetical protein
VVAALVLAASCAPASNSAAPPEEQRAPDTTDSPVASPDMDESLAEPTVPDAGAPELPAAPTAPAAAPWITPGERMGIEGCPLFPPDHAWRASIGSLPVHERSAAMIAATGGAATAVEEGFSSRFWDGSIIGIPFNVVDGTTAPRIDVVVTYDYGNTGAHLNYPLPQNPRFEGWPGKAWDAHLITVDTSTCESRELLNVRTPADDRWGLGGGRWYADAAATFDLTTTDATGFGVTAPNSSMLAGLVRFDEVAAGRIDHAIAATLGVIRAEGYEWPAMGTDGRSPDPDALPMGAWLRLRSDVDLSQLGPQARIVAEALRQHGAIVNDTGPVGVIKFQGEPDVRWDSSDVESLRTLTLADFEVVDVSEMMVSPDSYQLRPTR